VEGDGTREAPSGEVYEKRQPNDYQVLWKPVLSWDAAWCRGASVRDFGNSLSLPKDFEMYRFPSKTVKRKVLSMLGGVGQSMISAEDKWARTIAPEKKL